MKITILNTFDNQGGAAIATYRIHRALIDYGVKSNLLVQVKKTEDPTVIGPKNTFEKFFTIFRNRLDSIFLLLFPRRKNNLFSISWLPEKIQFKIKKLSPDLVHLFWVNGGFLKIETLRNINLPIVWTLHDMWPFTGGCHYNDGCEKFKDKCGKCPVLNSKLGYDLSSNTFNRKLNSWANLPITIVATSNWIAKEAKNSAIFKNKKIVVIPNCIDTEAYKPIKKTVARDLCNLPQNKKLILFSAFGAMSDRRKGGHLLKEALRAISKKDNSSIIELVVLGASKPPDENKSPFKTHYIPLLADEISQSLLYSAADVLVAPSLQENLSNTVIESMSCATPVVAFNIGGMPDIIKHKFNGYLADPFSINDFVNGILWVLEKVALNEELGYCARKTILENYSKDIVARQYADLYSDLINQDMAL